MKLASKFTHPCSQEWSSMTGDDKCRFCSQCQLHVHNLSAMNPDEQISVMSLPGRKCVAMVQNKDTIIVQSSLWLFIQRAARPFRAAAALMAFIVPMDLSSCASTKKTNPPPSLSTCPPAQAPKNIDGKIYAGGIMPPPSFWWRVTHFFRK